MMVTRPLGPALARSIRMLRRVVHLAADGSLQRAGIDDCGRRMPMGGRSGTRPILDEHDTHALARYVGQSLIEDDRDGRILAGRSSSRDAGVGGSRTARRDECDGSGNERRELVHDVPSPDACCGLVPRSQAERRTFPGMKGPTGANPALSRTAPKYVACASATTFRPSPLVARNERMNSAMPAASGPASSTTPFFGVAPAMSASVAATSSAATGWNLD